MRNKIRKLILEIIGNTPEEKKFFGEKFVKSLQDNVFLDVLPIVGNFSEYMLRLDYITNSLGLDLIGEGHFRHVFRTGNPDILLKVATDRAHPVGNRLVTAIDANEQEIKRFNRYPKFFPKSYAYSKDGIWLLVEKVYKVYKNSDEFREGLLKYFKPVGEIDKNIKDAIIAYSYQVYQNVLPHVSEEESASFDFSKFINDIEFTIMENIAGPGGGSGPAFYVNDKKDIFFDILRLGTEDGEEYSTAVMQSIEGHIAWAFNEIKIHWIGKNLRNLKPDNPEYLYFKFANTVLDKGMKPLIVDYVANKFYEDKDTRDFFIMMQREKITIFDIREENTGETKEGQFKIIDATTF